MSYKPETAASAPSASHYQHQPEPTKGWLHQFFLYVGALVAIFVVIGIIVASVLTLNL